jgi:hypothetical protein
MLQVIDPTVQKDIAREYSFVQGLNMSAISLEKANGSTAKADYSAMSTPVVDHNVSYSNRPVSSEDQGARERRSTQLYHSHKSFSQQFQEFRETQLG